MTAEILRYAQDDSEWAQDDNRKQFFRSLFSPARADLSDGATRIRRLGIGPNRTPMDYR